MSLKQIAASYGDPVKVVPYERNGITSQLSIRRLPFIELDNLRAATLDGQGKMDPARSAGHRARLIAAAVTDEDGTKYTAEDVGAWPDDMVLDIATLVQKHNGLDTEAVKDASKNSDSAPAAGG